MGRPEKQLKNPVSSQPNAQTQPQLTQFGGAAPGVPHPVDCAP